MRAFLIRMRPWSPLLVRFALAAICFAHAWTKLGGGMANYTAWVTDGLHLPRWTAFFAVWTGFAGCALLGLGFLTRLVSLAVAAVAVVIVFKVKLHSGFAGGLELPLLALAASLSLVLSGAGRLSLDRRFFGGE